ncbi:hypothetical protein O6H91_18G084100 [Diphasiastrum complanatum]|uniref:Uncharacterized protein n=1 Tax=Diphasiastrum complanatum TaxID=34168 RepID=A0ACC2B3F5_DIPCM|nr:hypothetical protein O6H91_Y331300 [Diphasiastrum complanatum]KAJ7524265.1 hypothetical protein O6H91_18G084100 [Diphasiastrum complanatum]
MLHPMEGESGPQVLPLNNFSNNGPPFFHQFFPQSCEHVQGGKQVTVAAWWKIPFELLDFGWGKPIYAGPVVNDRTLLSNGKHDGGLNVYLALLLEFRTERGKGCSE